MVEGLQTSGRPSSAGLRDSVDEFQRSVPGTTAKDVMNLVLMTQYFDMLKEIAASSSMTKRDPDYPIRPGMLTTLTEQMRNAMMDADQTLTASNADACDCLNDAGQFLAPWTARDANPRRAHRELRPG